MDAPRWVVILDALGPTLWLLSLIVVVGTAAAMTMAADRGRQSRRSQDRTMWMLDLTTSEDRAIREVGSGLLQLQARQAVDSDERRRLGELASATRGDVRPISLRLADGRPVSVMPSAIAAARLKIVTSRRLGRPAPQWVHALANAAEVTRQEGH